MTQILSNRRTRQAVIGAAVVLCALCALARDTQQGRQLARTQFETAERMREALNGKPSPQRTRREYQQVSDAYRRVYFMSPGSSKADASVAAVAELLVEQGRSFNNEKALRDAIKQYEFLRREYPGSKYRFDALIAIGKIYQQDLEEPEAAKPAFEEFLKRYPRHRLALEASGCHPANRFRSCPQEPSSPTAARDKDAGSEGGDAAGDGHPLLVDSRLHSCRHRSGSRGQVRGRRLPNPDRIFFDLHQTKLAPSLVGKSFDVADGFLRKIRVAQYQRDMAGWCLTSMTSAITRRFCFLIPIA